MRAAVLPPGVAHRRATTPLLHCRDESAWVGMQATAPLPPSEMKTEREEDGGED